MGASELKYGFKIQAPMDAYSNECDICNFRLFVCLFVCLYIVFFFILLNFDQREFLLICFFSCLVKQRFTMRMIYKKCKCVFRILAFLERTNREKLKKYIKKAKVMYQNQIKD